MKSLITFLTCFLFIFSTAHSQVKESITSGNWNNSATWGGSVPSITDSVFVKNSTIVTVDDKDTCAYLKIENGGILQFSLSNYFSALTITDDALIESGATLRASATPGGASNTTINHRFTVKRNLTVDGNIIAETISPAWSKFRHKIRLVMSGSGKSFLSGSNSPLLNTLEIDKPSLSDTLVIFSAQNTKAIYLISGYLDNSDFQITIADSGLILKNKNSLINRTPIFSGYSQVQYNDPSNIVAGNELPNTVNYVSVFTNEDVTLTKNVKVTNEILFLRGNIVTNENKLTLSDSIFLYVPSDAAGSVYGYVIGNLEREVNSHAEWNHYFYPVGTEDGFSPVYLDFYSFTDGSITVSPHKELISSASPDVKQIKRNFTLSYNNIQLDTDSYGEFYYRAGDIDEFPETDFDSLKCFLVSNNTTTELELIGAWEGPGFNGSFYIQLPQQSTQLTFGLREKSTPVESDNFSIHEENNIVTLEWITFTEQNNFGFEVQRKSFDERWESVGFLNGSGTSTVRKNYVFKEDISRLSIQTNLIQYRIKQIDSDGNFTLSKILSVFSSNQQKPQLMAAYPNPFNPETKIRFYLPVSGNAVISVYDYTGREIAELKNGHFVQGYHEVSFNGKDLSSGIYFYKLQSGNFTETKKMILMK